MMIQTIKSGRIDKLLNQISISIYYHDFCPWEKHWTNIFLSLSPSEDFCLKNSPRKSFSRWSQHTGITRLSECFVDCEWNLTKRQYYPITRSILQKHQRQPVHSVKWSCLLSGMMDQSCHISLTFATGLFSLAALFFVLLQMEFTKALFFYGCRRNFGFIVCLHRLINMV